MVMRDSRLKSTITLVLLISLAASATARAQDGTITETFDDPELQQWELSPEAVVSEGVLRISPGNFAVKFVELYEPTIDLRMRYTGEGEVMVQYHMRDESRYNLIIFGDGLVLMREETESFQDLAGGDHSIQSGEWFDLQVALGNGQHQISINEEVVLTTSDPEPLPPGAIFLHAIGEVVAEFDTMTVTPGTTEPPVPEEVPGEQPPEELPSPAEPTPVPTPTELDLAQEFFASQAGGADLFTFVVNLALAAVMSFILGRVYIHWGSSLSNRRRFAANFMLMTITTTFIILVVRSSVALSLGLVGALSIVRFRTAVKEPEELAYLFFAIGLGIGLGDNQRLITTLALAAGIVIIGLSRLTRRTQADVNLHLNVASHGSGKVDLEEVVGALEPHCAKIKLLRFDENEETLEMAFLVEFRRMSDLSQAKAALRQLSEGIEITFLDNRGIW
jgi:hypothetical protein